MKNNDFFMDMCTDAMQELASGKETWREIGTNTLFLAAFGMLYNHLVKKVVKPLYIMATSIFTGLVVYIIMSIIRG